MVSVAIFALVLGEVVLSQSVLRVPKHNGAQELALWPCWDMSRGPASGCMESLAA